MVERKKCERMYIVKVVLCRTIIEPLHVIVAGVV